GVKGKRLQSVQTFGTTTADLLALRDWLDAHGVTHVAMESTGVYWKPVYYLLEDHVTCLLVNAAHVKQVPGRKTDVQDCAWLAQLLEHGLLRGSFVPPAPIRELRDLTRYRKSLIQERAREANRVHKMLEDAGIKLATVARDVLGMSGRAMLEALVRGTRDPAVLAELARGRMRAKLPALRQALAGLSLAKTSSDSLRRTEIRQSVRRSKTPSLVGGRATGIVRPSALHGHTGVAMQDGERAGRAAELDL